VFSFQATVAGGTAAGLKALPAIITGTQSRTGSASISLNVTPFSTPPTGIGASSPNSLMAGASTLMTVTVTPGANPVSTGIAVSADLMPIGGSSPQQFFDDGTHGRGQRLFVHCHGGRNDYSRGKIAAGDGERRAGP